MGVYNIIVIDNPSHLIYGKDTPKIAPPKYRWITGDHQEGVKNYNKLLKEDKKKHIMIEQTYDLAP